jgi:altronate hydrolase
MNNVIKLNENDNVITALSNLKKGDRILVDGVGIILKEDIDRGHKIAFKNISKGDKIIKYGYPIGGAIKDINQGSHVHVHNVKTLLDELIEYRYSPIKETAMDQMEDRLVEVYRRKNGNIGIRNELWVIPTVGCSNGISEAIVKTFLSRNPDLGVDGVYAYTHPYGCSQMGEDHENTKIALQAMVKHPNAGGVLVVGLGCENNQIDIFRDTIGEYDEDRTRFMISQEEDDEIEAGATLLQELYNKARQDKREPASIGEVKIGLECGGSDGLSGITANPLLGLLSDYVISLGGTSVLTEVPEMFGAETILMDRAKDENIFDGIVDMVNFFKDFYKRHDQVIYDNPSPGNKKGGITTLEEKSLGCTQKAGSSAVTDVLKYGEILRNKGLNLVYSPGNDLVATTALGIAGCNMVLFTTGRGTPFGGFVPTVKISTNTALSQKKKNWIDFNAGKLTEGVTMEELFVDFVELIVEIINGKDTRNESNGFREIALFKTGVVL